MPNKTFLLTVGDDLFWEIINKNDLFEIFSKFHQKVLKTSKPFLKLPFFRLKIFEINPIIISSQIIFHKISKNADFWKSEHDFK
jgi:hypothetical protein